MKNKNINKKLAEICGWVGAVLIHSATVPTSISVIFGNNPNLPELSLVLLVWSGLILFLVRAIFQKDLLYIVSNLVGFILNSILLLIILL
jgi:hypothetical protein